MFRLSRFMEALRDAGPVPPARKAAGPVVIWNLIRRCNLNCRHCYATSADTDFKGELDTATERQEILDLIADSGADEDNPDVRAREELERRVEKLSQDLQTEVEAVEARGCVVKDLEHGLIDFYTLLGDRLVFLCWKSGEEEVAYWHPLQGGFSSRQPLERSEN